MATIPVICPNCSSENVIKHGKSGEGKQRYRCLNLECAKNTFILNYSYKGCLDEIKETIIDMAVNGSGIRDTARVLKIAPNTVTSTILKKAYAKSS